MPRDPFHFFFGPQMGPDGEEDQEPMVRRSSGSGFFISPSGEVLTNNHVVEDADKIEVQLADGTRYQVDVVGRDPATDIALLKVAPAETASFPYLALGSSDAAAGRRVGHGSRQPAQHGPHGDGRRGLGQGPGARPVRTARSRTSSRPTPRSTSATPAGRWSTSAARWSASTRPSTPAGRTSASPSRSTPRATILGQLRERGRVVRGYLGVMVGPIDQETAEAFKLDSRDGAFVQEVPEGPRRRQGRHPARRRGGRRRRPAGQGHPRADRRRVGDAARQQASRSR